MEHPHVYSRPGPIAAIFQAPRRPRNPLTGPHNSLIDVAGLSVGHATDLARGSGVTAIVFSRPAVASVLTLGGAPGGRDTGLLEPDMTLDLVDAILLSGGSAFGLDAAGGAQAALRAQGRGLAIGGMHVPIVPQAILFDLTPAATAAWGRYPPYRELGHDAVLAASAAPFAQGSVGAGTGATTATLKGGLGSASAITAAGHTVAALVAVNAIGSATLGDGPWFWAAPYEQGVEYGAASWPAAFTPEHLAPRLKSGRGTTIGLVATDAVLDKRQARRLAILADDGLARAILPAHLPMDGDTIFAASTGLRPLGDMPADQAQAFRDLCLAATLVMARAIARGVHAATALPNPGAAPAWRDRFG